MKVETIIAFSALAVSILSAVLSAFSLGWNIYRDVVFRARVRVSCGIMSVLNIPGIPDRTQFFLVTVINLGPGSVTIEFPQTKEATLWRRLVRRVKRAIPMPDWNCPLTSQSPRIVEVGQKATFAYPFTEDCILRHAFTHIGVWDTFGRSHWADKNDVTKARARWQKEFPTKATT